MTQADRERDAWERSVRALRWHGRRTWSYELANAMQQPLCSLPDKVRARWPLNLLCLIDVLEVRRSAFLFGEQVRLLTLAQRGMSLGHALSFYRNLRWVNRPLPDMHALQLWTKKQVEEEFGTAFGGPVADAIAEPGSQPILHALLFRQFDMMHLNTPVLAIIDMEIDSPRGAPAKIKEPFGVQEGFEIQPGTPFHYLPLGSAEGYYASATGLEAPDFSFTLNPLELDYAAEAEEAEKALREADRPSYTPDFR